MTPPLQSHGSVRARIQASIATKSRFAKWEATRKTRNPKHGFRYSDFLSKGNFDQTEGKSIHAHHTRTANDRTAGCSQSRSIMALAGSRALSARHCAEHRA